MEDKTDGVIRYQDPRLIVFAKNPVIKSIPQHISEPIQLQARYIFLQDTIVLTPNSSTVSRGHFANLASLLQFSLDSGALRTAVDAVALASLATRFGICEARPLAAAQYACSIRHIRAQLMASTQGTESLIASISLLSLYEILNADVIDNLNCVMHLRGIMAIMRSQVDLKHQPASAVELLILSTEAIDGRLRKVHRAATVTSSSGGNSIESGSSTPCPLRPTRMLFNELVSIFTKIASLFNQAAIALKPQCTRFEAQLRPLREQALSLRLELLAWSSRQPEEIQPVTVKRFTQPYSMSFPDGPDLICPALRTDSYTDYLVANMWISYRQCQLHLADLICRLNSSLEGSLKDSCSRRDSGKLRNEIESHIDDTWASMPFMLAGENVHYCRTEGAAWRLPKPPMLLGGLSMQWILFTIATLENAPSASKNHARHILSWFGETLGIGQAKVLAHMNKNPGITAAGDALRWSGFLL